MAVGGLWVPEETQRKGGSLGDWGDGWGGGREQSPCSTSPSQQRSALHSDRLQMRGKGEELGE